jgi:hypothetical protein
VACIERNRRRGLVVVVWEELPEAADEGCRAQRVRQVIEFPHPHLLVVESALGVEYLGAKSEA